MRRSGRPTVLKKAGTVGKMFFLAVVFILTNATASATVLDVPQKYQEKTQWCWAGCSQAILEYYVTTVTQTDIAAYGTPGTANTWNWLYGQSSNPTRRGIDLILHYFAGIDSTHNNRCLSQPEVTSDIGAYKPPVVRWNWDSGGGHFVVARGIEGDTMYLMDPWYGPTINSYAWVVRGGSHTWTDSLRLTTNPPTPTPTITPTPLETPTPTPTPVPTAVIGLNGTLFNAGEQIVATFNLNEPIQTMFDFDVYAVLIMPDGKILNARTLDRPVRPLAHKVKRLPAGFTYQLMSKTIPPSAPKGEYELAVVFFDAMWPYHSRSDAFLDVSAHFSVQ